MSTRIRAAALALVALTTTTAAAAGAAPKEDTRKVAPPASPPEHAKAHGLHKHDDRTMITSSGLDSTGTTLTSTATNATPTTTTPPSSVTLNLVAAYTDTAVAASGSVKQVQDEFARGVEQTNAAMSASGIPIRVRVADFVRVTGGTEDGQASTALKELYDRSDGAYREADAARAAKKADLIMLMTELDAGQGGQAVVNTRLVGLDAVGVIAPFSDPQRGYYTPAGALAHELGHTLGLDHDAYVSTLKLSPNAGYAAPRNGVMDIMAYSNACDAIKRICDEQNMYSDPTKTREGQPMGSASANIASYLKSPEVLSKLDGFDDGGRRSFESTQPFVSYSSPSALSTAYAETGTPMVRFSQPVTGTSTGVYLETRAGVRVPATSTYSTTSNTVTLKPAQPLARGAYRIVVTSQVRSVAKGEAVASTTIPFLAGPRRTLSLNPKSTSSLTPQIAFTLPADVANMWASVRLVGPNNEKFPWTWDGYGLANADGTVTWKIKPTVPLPPSASMRLRVSGAAATDAPSDWTATYYFTTPAS